MKIKLDVFLGTGTGDTKHPYLQKTLIVNEDFDPDVLEHELDKFFLANKTTVATFSDAITTVLDKLSLPHETYDAEAMASAEMLDAIYTRCNLTRRANAVKPCDKSVDIWL